MYTELATEDCIEDFLHLTYKQHICLFDRGNYYRLWRAGEAELVAEAAVCLVGVALHQVGHRVLRAPAVHHLLRRVVRVDDVRPGHVAEKLALFQLLDRFAELRRKKMGLIEPCRSGFRSCTE
jgi:hypothetical protein